MGITAFSISLLEKAIKAKPDITAVAEYGAQILYDRPGMPFASEWYESNGIEYNCFDLAGDNDAATLDLSWPQGKYYFPLVTDFGQIEHIVRADEYDTVTFDGGIHSVYPKGEIPEENIRVGFYQAWLNKHNFLAIGGIMVNENPLTGHWKGHGYSYTSADFYEKLSDIAGYEVIEAGTHCAMNNCETGKNVYSILRKTSDLFPSFEEFYEKLPIYRS